MAVIVYRDMRETIPAVDREALRAAAVAGQPGRYLASFENRFGEPLVFVHDDGERVTRRCFSAMSTGSRVVSAMRAASRRSRI